MLRKRKAIFKASLMLLVMSLCGCSSPTYYSSCPVYPVGGAKVGTELERLSIEEYPNTWEWLGRINKLRQELEVCK